MYRLELKFEAFLKEFPWLSKYVESGQASDIKVSRINESLMFKRRERVLVSCGFFVEPDLYEWTRILILDSNGNLQIEVGILPPKDSAAPWWRFWQRFPRRLMEETIGEAVDRLGPDVNRTHFILQLPVTTDDDAVIHKPPKGFSLARWREHIIEQEHQSLQRELQKVD